LNPPKGGLIDSCVPQRLNRLRGKHFQFEVLRFQGLKPAEFGALTARVNSCADTCIADGQTSRSRASLMTGKQGFEECFQENSLKLYRGGNIFGILSTCAHPGSPGLARRSGRQGRNTLVNTSSFSCTGAKAQILLSPLRGPEGPPFHRERIPQLLTAYARLKLSSISSSAPWRRRMLTKFCENAERGMTTSQPASCAFTLRSP
jgi:hypothetical protein